MSAPVVYAVFFTVEIRMNAGVVEAGNNRVWKIEAEKGSAKPVSIQLNERQITIEGAMLSGRGIIYRQLAQSVDGATYLILPRPAESALNYSIRIHEIARRLNDLDLLLVGDADRMQQGDGKLVQTLNDARPIIVWFFKGRVSDGFVLGQRMSYQTLLRSATDSARRKVFRASLYPPEICLCHSGQISALWCQFRRIIQLTSHTTSNLLYIAETKLNLWVLSVQNGHCMSAQSCYIARMERSKTQMRRLLELHEFLKGEKFPNCSSFGKRWEVSDKTIQRDIDFLRDQLGAPIGYDALKRGYYYTDPFFMLPSISLSEGELAALVIGSKALEQYKGTPIASKLEKVLEKLSALLPDTITLDPVELYSNFSFSSPPAIRIKPAIWEVVVKGLLAKRQMEISYKGKVSRIHPLHLANLQGAWYLFVRFYDYTNFKQISLGRIEKASLLKQAVDADGFDPDVFLADTLYRFAGDNEPFTVRLKFSPEVADAVIEREWHLNQEVTTLKDGSVELTFTAKGDIELKRWIMAWGRYCSVIEPMWVCDMIDAEVSAMVENRTRLN
jgi:predicted DNA-binding transcriptional regulator YafY